MVVEGRSRSRSLLSFELTLLFFSFFLCFSLSLSGPDLLEEETVANSSVASLNASSTGKPKEGSFADIIDRALEKEFNESDQTEGILNWIRNLVQCGIICIFKIKNKDMRFLKWKVCLDLVFLLASTFRKAK